MSSYNGKKLVGSAAAAAVVGLFVVPAPAHARPDFECYSQGGYQFPGGQVILHYPETDAETRFNAPRGLTVDAPAVTVYKSGVRLDGRVSGSIEKGGNIIRLKVTRKGYEPLFVDGAIIDNNTPAGSFAWENHDRQLWDSPTEFACVPGSPPPVADQLPPREQPVAANPGPTEAQAPPPQEAAAPAPEEAAAPPPEEAAPPPPEQNQPCIPDPFDLNFPGAC